MIYFVIIIVLALVVGPVLWVRPSPRTRQLERLRQYARENGLQVQMRAVPSLNSTEREIDSQIMAYIRPWKKVERIKGLPDGFLLGRPSSEGDWTLYRAKNRLLDDDMVGLPESAKILEVSEEGVILYWRETGNKDRVELLAQTLEKLAHKLVYGLS